MLTQTDIDQVEDGIAIVKFTGRLTLGSSMSLAEAKINQLIEQEGVLKIVFDLTNVDFVDSAGLGLVVFMRGKLLEKGGRFRVVSPPPRVLDLFRMSNNASVLDIDAVASESVDKLKA